MAKLSFPGCLATGQMVYLLTDGFIKYANINMTHVKNVINLLPSRDITKIAYAYTCRDISYVGL